MDHFLHAALRFDVHDAGPRDAEAIVLLHGFPQQPSAWDRVVPALHEAGFRTLAPSLRGYTATSRPRPRRAYAVSETTSDVVALLDAAEIERAHVVGHDWGAAPTWGMGGWHPDRTASLTVLSTPHPAAMQRAFVHSRQALASWYMFVFQLPGLPEAAARRTLQKTLTDSGLPAEEATAYVAAMAEPGALTGALNWYRGMPFSRRPVGRISAPTTYVWGRHDFALLRYPAEATADYVTGPYAFVELDAGHWLPETEPAAVADAILQRARSAGQPPA